MFAWTSIRALFVASILVLSSEVKLPSGLRTTSIASPTQPLARMLASAAPFTEFWLNLTVDAGTDSAACHSHQWESSSEHWRAEEAH